MKTRKQLFLIAVIVGLAGVFMAGSARATSLSDVGSYAIDFRADQWTGTTGTSYTVDYSSTGFGEVTVTAGYAGTTYAGLGWWGPDSDSNPDGLGIYGNTGNGGDGDYTTDKDEIDAGIAYGTDGSQTAGSTGLAQTMSVHIENGIMLTGIGLTDLFRPDPDGSYAGLSGEKARVQLYDSTKTLLDTVYITADQILGQSNGEQYYAYSGPTPVYWLDFTANIVSGDNNITSADRDDKNNNYSLAAIDGTVPVPEPSTILLSGLGLLALGIVLRRRVRPA